MKRILMLLLPALVLFAGCQDEIDNQNDDNAKKVGTFKQAEVVAAAADVYAEWESEVAIPEKMTIAGKELTLPQYQYAMLKALIDIKANSAADVVVLNYKAADHPERDSYDAEEIAVFNGPANGENTEDLANVAKRMIEVMVEKGQVPNQTLFTRDGSSIAFSTNRATVTVARALAAYKKDGKMPAKVSTEYLAPGPTLKTFAEQFVTYLDVWENNVAEKLSADGSHCSDNNSAWENVHFIPIPYSGGSYPDGTDQYDPKYQPYHTITVGGVTYTADQCWGIALKGILDLITVEGSTTWAVERNPATPAHTAGNGKSLTTEIPTMEEWFTWGGHPWYEKSDDPCAVQYNGQPLVEVDADFLVRLIPWHLTRSSQLGAIGNFQTFGDDPGGTLIYEGYQGNICPMRELLIAARFYKYLLDNNIEDNVYDAVKNVKFDADLYGSEAKPISVDKASVSIEHDGGSAVVNVLSQLEAWTVENDAEWVTVSPESGDAADAAVEVTITAVANDGKAREAVIKFVTAAKTVEVKVNQTAKPGAATIRDFAAEYVKIIDVWARNVGTMNYVTGFGATTNPEYEGSDVENAHYIPAETTITVGGVEYNTADMLELALRSYLVLRGKDGIQTENNGAGNYGALDGYTMESILPQTHNFSYGSMPFNESEGNGGEYRMNLNGEDVELTNIKLLDNWAERNCNWAISHDSQISNGSGYNQRSGFEEFSGTFSAQRGLISYAFFFKYMLENNLEDAKSIAADQTFRSELFGVDEPVSAAATIKDFAKEYVKIIDVWQKTTGTVNYVTGVGATTNSEYADWDVANAHYVPAETTITVGGVEYNTADMLELALRSYLALRGKDGIQTEINGQGAYPALDGYTMSSELPETHDFKYGSMPFNESGSTGADGKANGNGGEFRMGTPPDGVEETNIKQLDNWAERNCNWAMTHNLEISNGSGYNQRSGFEEYYGQFSAQRGLITYAFFFKYMLDNNLEDAKSISADQKFRTELFGVEDSAEETAATIMDFAKEYVKIIDVWQKTTGTVNYVTGVGATTNSEYTDWDVADAHYVPADTKITVKGVDYNTADMLELALRSYLALRGKDGIQTEINGQGAYPALDGYTMSSELPETHDFKYGSMPFNESGSTGADGKANGNGGEFRMGTPPDGVEETNIKQLDNWAERNCNWAMTHNLEISNGSGYNQRSGFEEYYGNFCAQRGLITYAYFFKYMIDNNLNDAKSISADQKFTTKLFK